MTRRTYSRLNVRERLDADIQSSDKDIQFYEQCGPEWLDKIEELNERKARIQARAGHYDREAEAGNTRPASQRNGITTGLSEGLGSTVSLDE